MVEHIRTFGTPLANAWIASPCNVLYEFAKQAPGRDLDLELGGHVFPVVQSAAAARTVLRDRDGRYAKYFGSYKNLFGASRLTTDGAIWRKLRDYSQPFISDTDADDIVTVAQDYFTTAADDLLVRNQGRGAGSVDDAIDFAAAATVCKLVLGFPIADWGPQTISDVRKVLRFASYENFPQPGGGGAEVAMMQLDAEDARRDLNDRFRALLDGEAARSGQGLVGRLLRANDPDVDMFGELSTLLFAGFDTTASSITWSMYLLAREPELQSHLRASVVGLSSKPDLSAADILSLHDLSAFYLEALRIFPPIPVLSRMVTQDHKLDGWDMREGQRVLVSFIGVHHDRTAFADPFRVKLDRHPNGQLTRENTAHFLPFGDGKRICPGARFANLEALTALAVLLDKGRLTPTGQPLRLKWDASMRLEGGTRLGYASV